MPEAHEPTLEHTNSDETHLAKLGYKQELQRSWSGFSNFAISFSIISILAGCLTNYTFAINNGGPSAVSWTWPILSVFILIVGFTMSELVSSYPTSGGIYWWASKLGGPKAGFYAGWLNWIGLIAVTSGVAYGCATFIDYTISAFSTSYADNYSLKRVFVIFVIVLLGAAVLNIFSSHLMALMNNVSVWWHVAGAAIFVIILVLVPKHHLSFAQVFGDRFNNSGFNGGHTGGLQFWFLILPFAFLLTQYTITGFDASAHLSEETTDAATTAAKGIWQSIFYSALGGYILLLAVTFAIPKGADGKPAYGDVGLGGVPWLFAHAMNSTWAGILLVIASVAQFFCATACVTAASRMTIAFSRDGALPISGTLRKLNAAKVPANAVICVAVLSAILTLPALIPINGVPVAYFAVTSIAVQGLYLSFAIPIYLRWKHGENFEVGAWNNGSKYKWMNIIAVAEIIIVCLYLMLPTTPAGTPGNKAFDWASLNYTPIVTIGALILLTIWWYASVKNWFKGPLHTIDDAVLEAFGEDKMTAD
jgi:amino acid transporter